MAASTGKERSRNAANSNRGDFRAHQEIGRYEIARPYNCAQFLITGRIRALEAHLRVDFQTVLGNHLR